MSYYIKGNKERGAEVIALLESKGGTNVGSLLGTDKHAVYYINKRNIIDSCSIEYCQSLIAQFCDELTLPEKKEKVWTPKYKVGDYVRNQEGVPFVVIYCPSKQRGLYGLNFCSDGTSAASLEDKLIPWEPKRGERVLIKDSEDSAWKEGIFSFQESFLYFIEGGLSWHYCIPFDENKLGKVTD